MIGPCGDNREASASFDIPEKPKRSLFDCICLSGLVAGYIVACIAYFILGKNGANLAFIIALSNIFTALLGVKYGERIKEAVDRIRGS